MSKGIQKTSFGRLPDGTEIDLYTLTNANGLTVKITNYGATLVEIRTPDRHGKFANIILGYDRLEDYVNGKDYRGAIIGRVANRIAGASFTLNGKTYQLAANDGPNHLHGGIRGFDKQIWKNPGILDSYPSVDLWYMSADMEEGYPGTLTAWITFQLTDGDELRINYLASAAHPTPVNLTSHPYWNLSGKGDILNHELMVAADYYTPMDSQHIPTGKIDWVGQTPFEFRSPTAIGNRLDQLCGKPPGYNVNFALRTERHDKNGWIYAARARDPESGRALDLWTDQPGLQFYSGTFLGNPYTGFCLETQNFPDAVHHENFPSSIFGPDRAYQHNAFCRFSTD